ncbi:DgyrCDS3729 [Dimorphilus gyrociliatus]|uniref:Heparan-sulfate 6-O-sulfotransferase n=1 Tax=Dimorphilus gyrociliatus TaxID=2664684 RepID=A0A7I8VEJ5_9ANNE|nr:DgyrCDS3729 [Dimorphilus gyrociliatus]
MTFRGGKWKIYKLVIVFFIFTTFCLFAVYLLQNKPASFDLTAEFSNEDTSRQFKILQNNEFVLVFVHIQKTGGSYFGRQLVKSLDMKKPCKCKSGRKRCNCTRDGKIWLFSRYSTGWACGLHADWTELHECVNEKMNKIEKDVRKRSYLYITNVRDPLKRYLSEWKHTQRGATWKDSSLLCDGREYKDFIQKCYEGENWMGVGLEEFYSCSYNLANNRQTRMLANLSLINCYNSKLPKSEIDNILLESAKKNLRAMAYFGLTEYQIESQFLFERTFNVKFLVNFLTINNSRADRAEISSKDLEAIHEANELDFKLYDYAKELFFKRFNQIKKDYFMKTGLKFKPIKSIINNTILEEMLNDYGSDEDDVNAKKKNALSLLKQMKRHLKVDKHIKKKLKNFQETD